MTDVLERLQRWYRSNCDGTWEHGHGVTITTLDNPGWEVEVDLNGTLWAERGFAVVEDRYDSEGDWLRCWKDGATFQGACGPERLRDVLVIFLDWAESGAGVTH